MPTVNISQAKSSFSRLVEDIEKGRVKQIIIARNGRPVAKLVPLDSRISPGQRLGVAKGLFEVPDSIDEVDADLVQRLQALVGDVDVNLDARLSKDDE